MKEKPDSWPHKAYKNLDFLNSAEARKIRVLAEMTEPEHRFRQHNIEDTLVIFGSARTIHIDEAKQRLSAVEKRIQQKPGDERSDAAELRLARSRVKLAPYYQATVDLARELTEWSLSLKGEHQRFVVCSGGGPGIMEAANRGATEAGGSSIGLGISLPFEQHVNPYIPRDLQFEFHYFFVRKYWFMLMARCLVAMPGGFGTMDELFEVLTLIQTHKVEKKVPIVLFGSEFWDDIINFNAFVEWGVISPEDVNLYRKIDTVAEAKKYIIDYLTQAYLETK
ncbi:MAG: LOG family protein [Opitutales bacterium]|nr:LOG family protein [Opitutales bacterium]